MRISPPTFLRVSLRDTLVIGIALPSHTAQDLSRVHDV
jgi:hypothetical protein